MPNWIKGTMKLRGQSEDLKRFFKDGVGKSSWFEDDARPIADFVQTDFDGEWCEVTFKSEPWIKGTRRAFIEGDYVGWGESFATIAIEVKQAWGFDTEAFAEISKKYNLDIRLYGFERGMEFCQEIEIIKGKITINKEITYDDWVWEFPMPNMGG